jgi:hypothetical protein
VAIRRSMGDLAMILDWFFDGTENASASIYVSID